MTTHTLTIGNKKYTYNLKPIGEKLIQLECKAAKINQEFLKEDLSQILLDLPNLILAEKEYQSTQNEVIRFRVSNEDKKEIEQKAHKKGYKTVSSFLRDLALGI